MKKLSNTEAELKKSAAYKKMRAMELSCRFPMAQILLLIRNLSFF